MTLAASSGAQAIARLGLQVTFRCSAHDADQPSPELTCALPVSRVPTRLPTHPNPTLNNDRATGNVSSESLLLAMCLFWALVCNSPFLQKSLAGRLWSEPGTWGFAAALVLLLVCVHFLLLAPLAVGRLTKPVLAFAALVTAVASHYTQTLGVYLDPTMLRNAQQTDWHETRELLSLSLLWHVLLYAAVPVFLMWRVRLRQRTVWRAGARRLLATAAALIALVGVIWAVFQPFSSLMRGNRELRYLITPANVGWSTVFNLASTAKGAALPRQPIGLDATPGPRLLARQTPGSRPLVVVLVVGETARYANWGLSGYARQTTPRLAQLPVINFTGGEAGVQACGTNTEVSLPCMFAPVGRRDYDEERIRGSESLLHVLARAGVAVHWRDNQSGCKGVCEGLPQDDVASLNPSGLCKDGRCMDEGLLSGLEERLAQAQRRGGHHLWVLHQLGNHGPSYFRRYEDAFARFTPACKQDDLRLCSREEIVNAYDNALLYTDHVLASLVNKLQAAADQVDTVLVYVSDHGESLGENNLFLHGMPYAIAPDVQKRVPMVMWLSPRAPAALKLNLDCLRQRATQSAAHDHLFHTLLGLLDVRTALFETTWDLTSTCRN